MDQPTWRTEGVEPLMSVYSSDGMLLGRVKSVREHDFIVERDLQRDIIVAITLVKEIEEERDRLVLALTEAQADAHDWEHPPIV